MGSTQKSDTAVQDRDNKESSSQVNKTTPQNKKTTIQDNQAHRFFVRRRVWPD